MLCVYSRIVAGMLIGHPTILWDSAVFSAVCCAPMTNAVVMRGMRWSHDLKWSIKITCCSGGMHQPAALPNRRGPCVRHLLLKKRDIQIHLKKKKSACQPNAAEKHRQTDEQDNVTHIMLNVFHRCTTFLLTDTTFKLNLKAPVNRHK